MEAHHHAGDLGHVDEGGQTSKPLLHNDIIGVARLRTLECDLG